jgi:transposase
MMEVSAPAQQCDSTNCTQESRATVDGQTNNLARRIADVAKEHGLNANMVAS